MTLTGLLLMLRAGLLLPLLTTLMLLCETRRGLPLRLGLLLALRLDLTLGLLLTLCFGLTLRLLLRLLRGLMLILLLIVLLGLMLLLLLNDF